MQFTNVQPGSPEEILLNVKQGKASYAQIYETLCSYAGLHCRVIRGYAKGADYKPGMSVLQAGALCLILYILCAQNPERMEFVAPAIKLFSSL